MVIPDDPAKLLLGKTETETSPVWQALLVSLRYGLQAQVLLMYQVGPGELRRFFGRLYPNKELRRSLNFINAGFTGKGDSKAAKETLDAMAVWPPENRSL